MAGLPQWEYIVIIICSEIILAVAITLVVYWRCRWAKKDTFHENDDKKPLPAVDDVMDDMFKKDSAIVVGHAPQKHEYSDFSEKCWSIKREKPKEKWFKSTQDESVGFKNEAFISLEKEKSQQSLNIMSTDDMISSDTLQKNALLVNIDDDNGKMSRLTVMSQNHDSNSFRQDVESRQTKANLHLENLQPGGPENEHEDHLLVATHHQPTTSLRENGRLTPVEFDVKEKTTPEIVEPVKSRQSNIRQPTPLVVQSVDNSAGLFVSDAHRKQFNRDVAITRSPPPSYHSATGRRTNPRMGQPANLTGGDTEDGRLSRHGPLWESQLLILKRV